MEAFQTFLSFRDLAALNPNFLKMKSKQNLLRDDEAYEYDDDDEDGEDGDAIGEKGTYGGVRGSYIQESLFSVIVVVSL